MEKENYNSYGNRKPNGKKPFQKPYKNFKQKRESLDDIIDRRNKRLTDFFKLCDISVRIIGDKNSPAIIYQDAYVLNAYVHNFELRFTDNPDNGNVIYTVKLTEKPNFDKNTIQQAILSYPKKSVYTIKLWGTSPTLMLSGYNFLNKEQKLGRYPVFSAYHPKIYFTQEKAEEIMAQLAEDGYECNLS
jgi:hypothetical protein